MLSKVRIVPTKPTIDADYQCNDAFAYAKQMKANPKEIATKICNRLESDPARTDIIERVEVAGPGFINIHLRSSWIVERAVAVADAADVAKGGLGGCFREKRMMTAPATPEKVLLDFASPNMSKELHVGHLRSSVIGDTLSRLLASQGYSVSRVSHVGDWGPPMAMVIEELREMEHPSLFDTSPATTSLHLPEAWELSAAYVRAKQKGAEDESKKSLVAATLKEL
eukprot:g4701.t1